MRTRKRSSCASGSGYVPSYSIGFCTLRGEEVQLPRHVLERHLPLFARLEQRGLRLARRAVDLVASRMFVKTGPRSNVKLPLERS